MFKALTFKNMTFKSLFAAGALAAAVALALPAPAAQAGGVSVGVGFGIYPPPQPDIGWAGGYDGGNDGGYAGSYGGGYGSYNNGYNTYNGGYNNNHYSNYGGWVSCRDGRRILWRSGYSDIEVQSCRRGYYRYTAWRRGKQYLMAVDARGDVARLRRIY